MINVGDEQISSLFVGDMGVKTALIRDETIYQRSGGYFYLELVTEEAE